MTKFEECKCLKIVFLLMGSNLWYVVGLYYIRTGHYLWPEGAVSKGGQRKYFEVQRVGIEQKIEKP